MASQNPKDQVPKRLRKMCKNQNNKKAKRLKEEEEEEEEEEDKH